MNVLISNPLLCFLIKEDDQAERMIDYMQTLGIKKLTEKYPMSCVDYEVGEGWRHQDLTWGDYRPYGGRCIAQSGYMMIQKEESTGDLYYYFRNNNMGVLCEIVDNEKAFVPRVYLLVVDNENKEKPVYRSKQSAIDYLLKEHGVVVHKPFTIYDALSCAADNGLFINEDQAEKIVQNALENSIYDINDRIEHVVLMLKQEEFHERNKQ